MEKETTPSQSEWLIMEVFWASDTSLTAKEVIKKIQDRSDMSPRMVRVLINRLCQKGVLSYTVDEYDSRVYHYSVMKSKEECQKEKSRKFINNYFEGSQKNAMAALLQDAKLTEEQFQELEELLEQCKEKESGRNSDKKKNRKSGRDSNKKNNKKNGKDNNKESDNE